MDEIVKQALELRQVLQRAEAEERAAWSAFIDLFPPATEERRAVELLWKYSPGLEVLERQIIAEGRGALLPVQ